MSKVLYIYICLSPSLFTIKYHHRNQPINQPTNIYQIPPNHLPYNQPKNQSIIQSINHPLSKQQSTPSNVNLTNLFVALT